MRKKASPPMYLKCDLKELRLSPETLGTKFDVILIDPPWDEYAQRKIAMARGLQLALAGLRARCVSSPSRKLLSFVIIPGLTRHSRLAPLASLLQGCPSDDEVWDWQEIRGLPIEELADTPCFVFLWCESGRRDVVPVETPFSLPSAGMVPLLSDPALCCRCGARGGVDQGRACLQKWGFRCGEHHQLKTASGGRSRDGKTPSA